MKKFGRVSGALHIPLLAGNPPRRDPFGCPLPIFAIDSSFRSGIEDSHFRILSILCSRIHIVQGRSVDDHKVTVYLLGIIKLGSLSPLMDRLAFQLVGLT